jgi:hypothetical protein
VLTRSGRARTCCGGLRRRHDGGRHRCGCFGGGGVAETLAGGEGRGGEAWGEKGRGRGGMGRKGKGSVSSSSGSSGQRQ